MTVRGVIGRLLRWTLGAFAVVCAIGFGMGACVFAGPHYHGPVSDHFDGKQFFTPNAPKQGNVLTYLLTSKKGPWSEYRDFPPGPPPPQRVTDGKMRVTFINHATTLIQADGLNILTDPIWSERCSPLSWAGPKRVRPPGIRFEDLPPIDVVVISHDHYDHMDIATLKRLAHDHKPKFFVGLGNGPLLKEAGIDDVTELDWWQSVPLKNGVTLFSVPTQHFSNRGLTDRNATLWTGYLIKGPSGMAYFAGDTAFGPHFEEVRKRFGPPRVAILPIGAFRPQWFMGPVHMSPSEAFDAHRLLGAGTSIAIHFGTFPLADDGETEAPDLLRAEIAKATPPANPFLILGFGEGYDVPPGP